MPDIREESPAGVRRSRSIGSHRSEPVQLRGCLTLLELSFLDGDSIKRVLAQASSLCEDTKLFNSAIFGLMPSAFHWAIRKFFGWAVCFGSCAPLGVRWLGMLVGWHLLVWHLEHDQLLQVSTGSMAPRVRPVQPLCASSPQEQHFALLIPLLISLLHSRHLLGGSSSGRSFIGDGGLGPPEHWAHCQFPDSLSRVAFHRSSPEHVKCDSPAHVLHLSGSMFTRIRPYRDATVNAWVP